MKYRTDFVTNSSSSSFVIASKEDNLTVKLEINVASLCDSVIHDINELNDWYIDFNNWSESSTIEEILEDKDTRERYDKQKKLLEEGYVIYCGEVSSDSEDGLSIYIYNDGLDELQGDFIVLEDLWDRR